MPILIVNNTVFSYPASGQDPSWGEEATSWAVAVTDVLSTLLAPGDIVETSFVVANNVTAGTTIVNGLTFDAATTRAANIDYSVYRTSTGSPSGNSENGTIYLTYDTNASSGSKWIISNTKHAGDAGIIFDIGDNGQITYKTTDLGAGAVGTMRFRAKTLAV